jgi:hypothetical protein
LFILSINTEQVQQKIAHVDRWDRKPSKSHCLESRKALDATYPTFALIPSPYA